MPRPKKLPQESRTRRIPNARISEAERDRILQRAKTAHLSPCEYVRKACLEKEIVARNVTDFQTVQEFNRIGNNLNQLVKYTHIHHQIDVDELNRILGLLEDAIMVIIDAALEGKSDY